MKRTGLALLAILILSFLAGSVPLAAQEIVERPVRLDPPGEPAALRPTAATDGDHRFAVAWRTVGPAGQAIGAAVIDASTGIITHPDVPDPEPGPAIEGSRPAVAVRKGGDFLALIGWGELLENDFGCVFTRFVDANRPVLGEDRFPCFPTTAAPQVALAELPEGFAIVWTQPVGSATGQTAVFLRLLTGGGRPNPSVRVWRRSPGPQIAPQVLSDAAGRLLVAWQQPWPDGRPRLLARRFGPDAAPLGPAFQLDTGTFLSGRPRLAGAPDGGFVAAWEELVGDEGVVHARLFDPSGSLRRALAHEYSGHLHAGAGRPDVAMDSRGNVALAWEGRDLGDDPDEAVIAYLFNDAGRREGSFQLSGEQAAGRQGSPAVALADTGRVLLAWESQQPGEETEVHARIFDIPGDDDPCVYRGDTFRCFEERQIRFGNGIAAGDRPFLADVDGDGDDDPCVRRGAAFLCDTAHDGGEAEVTLPFGTAADTPLMGDLDGDGREDPCVRRGRRWLCDTAHDGGAAELRLAFGRATDPPFLGDIDGDGDDDPCILRAVTAELLCDLSHDGFQDLRLDLADLLPGNPFLLGDANGDGTDDPCVQRGSELRCDTSRQGLSVRYGSDPILPGDVVLLGDIDNF